MVRNELKHAYQPWGRVNYDSTWKSVNNLGPGLRITLKSFVSNLWLIQA